jgi:predicted DNA binding protein
VVRSRERAGGSLPRRRRTSPHLASDSAGEGPFSLFRIAAQLPTDSWGYHFSRSHPDLALELLNRIELGPGLLLTEVRMVGPDAEAWRTESRKFAQVVSVASHPEGPGSVLYRVTSRTPSIHEVTQRHHVLTRYPILIRDGWSRFETFGSAAQMRAYLAELSARVGPTHLEAARQGSVSRQSLGLTPIQDAIFRAAVSSGYYASPRRISVTNLARRLGRSKSTVSTALVRIQKQLAESALRLDLATFRAIS